MEITMATVTVQTKNGPVLVDEDQIEAWGGEVVAEKPEPKRKPKPSTPDLVASDVVSTEDGKFMLVDQNGNQFGETLFDTADAALQAMG